MKILYFILVLAFLAASATAATLHGQIYNLDLNLEPNVKIEINTIPQQQHLAKNGEYAFNVPVGEYLLKAKKGELIDEKKVKIIDEGEFVLDLFLMPSFEEEDQLSLETGAIETDAIDNPDNSQTGTTFWNKYPLWSYLLALGLFLIAFGRIILAKRKYKKPKKKKENEESSAETEEKETDDESKENSDSEEPAYLEETLEILKKHEGRISQKELRKEMIHLSEAKISLILTELEHKKQIEKVKKGRGNVVILK